MNIRRAEPYGINGYYIPVTGLDFRDSERFPWGSYETLGFVNRFPPVISKGFVTKNERTHEEISNEIECTFSGRAIIYAPSGKKDGGRFVVMRLLEKKVE